MLRTFLQNRLFLLTLVLGICGILMVLAVAIAGAKTPQTTIVWRPVPQKSLIISVSKVSPLGPENPGWEASYIVTLPNGTAETHSLVVPTPVRTGDILTVWERQGTQEVSASRWPDERKRLYTFTGNLRQGGPYLIIILGFLTAISAVSSGYRAAKARVNTIKTHTASVHS